MKITDEYRLIHPQRIFSILVNILKELNVNVETDESLNGSEFLGRVTGNLPAEKGETEIHAQLKGINKVWKKFEPLGSVWRSKLSIEVTGQNSGEISDQIKEELFWWTLRAGG
ncbi:MAG: hypothetical protein GWO20_09760 [Candidatus Korarchaeota archaeon]|nr:hypothetical protein [Candidatus Korarchaeota archaeon]NIU83771.1 hypothetical protein [Candidatus Thorarchaeota archaeon]NIW15356.1 hypothetical protein [Candidatus Thorarchaeota archaeon]NIW52082.1 hypothetical protein [Candidatus Korarchaeota archaeon]